MKATRFPGVKMISPGTFRVRGRVIDPRTGLVTEVKQIVEAPSALDAAVLRDKLLAERESSTTTTRMTVGAFAKLWLEAKSGVVADTTLEGYANSLIKHVLPGLGHYFYDAMGPMEVQTWINRSLQLKDDRGRPKFSRRTIEDWLRVFRNMTRDAIAQLSLTRDPTMRVKLPEQARSEDEDKGKAVLTTEEFPRFMLAMRERPASFALVVVLGLTGQRFCHVSALRWSDIDFEANVIRFRRKQNRGVVGPISKRKPAPREVPMVPVLAAVLKAHKVRQDWLERRGSGEGRGTSPEDYLFLSNQGTFKQPSSLSNAFKACAKAAGISKNVTPHSLRYGFNDMLRRSGIDAISARALTGHVTQQMQEHYSNVLLDDKRAAIALLAAHVGVLHLSPALTLESRIKPEDE